MNKLQDSIVSAELPKPPAVIERLYVGKYKIGPVSTDISFSASDQGDADAKFKLFVEQVKGIKIEKVVQLGSPRPLAADLDEIVAKLKRQALNNG